MSIGIGWFDCGASKGGCSGGGGRSDSSIVGVKRAKEIDRKLSEMPKYNKL